jgi:hypothetical protein
MIHKYTIIHNFYSVKYYKYFTKQYYKSSLQEPQVGGKQTAHFLNRGIICYFGIDSKHGTNSTIQTTSTDCLTTLGVVHDIVHSSLPLWEDSEHSRLYLTH